MTCLTGWGLLVLRIPTRHRRREGAKAGVGILGGIILGVGLGWAWSRRNPWLGALVVIATLGFIGYIVWQTIFAP